MALIYPLAWFDDPVALAHRWVMSSWNDGGSDGPALQTKAALSGKHVVTANKAIAGSIAASCRATSSSSFSLNHLSGVSLH